MKAKYLKKSIISLVIIFLVFGAHSVLATSDLYKNLNTAAGSDLAKTADPLALVGGILKAVLSLLGVVLLIIIIYAGAIWGFLSGGEAAKIKKAKDMIVNAVIGLLIVFGSYAIVSFVISNIAKNF